MITADGGMRGIWWNVLWQ